jgi:predicted ATP-grasp superfamily ATP-dependent carboligase
MRSIRHSQTVDSTQTRRLTLIEWESTPTLRSAVMVTAFEGWNDAGEAATDTVDHIRQVWDAAFAGELDPDDYYDFQVTRPHIRLEGGTRIVTWPTTRFYVARGEERDFVLVHGIEPNLHWRAFCQDIIAVARDLEVELVVNLGALLADVPHTRPVPLTAFATQPALIKSLGLEESSYEGPTGIVGVLQNACDVAEIPALSLWAAVPHYVAQTPCPKAALALLRRLEDVSGATVPDGDLPDEAAAWQRGVEEMASDDQEIREYVEQLERARDSEDLTETSGDAIAAEFERYLRRRSE